MGFNLDFNKNIQKSVIELIQQRVDSCRTALQNTEDPHQGIHQARKDLKKIRALCRLVRYEIGKKAYKAANYYFRDVARMLSEARDTSVIVETVQGLETHFADADSHAVLQKAKNYFLGKKGALTRININQEHLLHNVEEQLKDAESYYTSWSFKHKGFKAVAPGLEKVYGSARNSMKHAYNKNNGQYYHEWRKQVKYLRYQLDAIKPIWPGMLSAWEEELHQITDMLGEEHDLAVLRDQLKQMEWEEDMHPKTVLKTITARRKELREEAYPLAQKLFRQKPADFVAMLKDYWKISQSESKQAIQAG